MPDFLFLRGRRGDRPRAGSWLIGAVLAVIVGRRLMLVLLLMFGMVLVLDSGWAGGQSGYFGDVSGTHEAGVDALAAEGLLEGTECEPGLLCPDKAVKRWVMAVWLVRAVDGSDPVDRPAGRFGDVPSDVWWATHVERLAELGVTLGCGDGSRFCPDDPVTRGQMAAFLVRAFKLDAAPTSGFGDVRGHFHEDSIRILAAERITAGCSTDPLMYCPNRSVTRGQMATFLARALDLIPRPEPDAVVSQRLLFVTGRANELRLWESDSGTDPITIAIVDKNLDKGGIYNPQLSPDGETISYNLSESIELWVVGLDGSNWTKVSDLSHHYEWSPDGLRLWYIDVSTGELWVVDADGSNNTKLAAEVEGYSYARDPGWAAWSPDGSRIAYEGRDDSGYNRQLWVVDVAGSNNRKLIDGADRFVRWSPDGSRIAYTTGSADALWIIDVDGSNNRKLADMNLASEIRRGAHVLRSIYYWAPDGSGIVYNARDDTGRWDELWMVDADSSYSIKLADRVFSWNPYGFRIAYLPYPSELWVVDVDGSKNTKLADNIIPYTYPSWSPSGSRIAYTTKTAEDDVRTIIVDLDGSDGELLGDRADMKTIEVPFTDGSWSPDDSHMAYFADYRKETPVLYLSTSDLYLLDLDSLTTAKLVDDQLRYPSWSPDGSLIAYKIPDYSSDSIQLWVVNTVDYGMHMISDDVSEQLIWVSRCYTYYVYPHTGWCYRGSI